MTNKPMLSVERELLEDFADYADKGKVAEPYMAQKLRALLDAQHAVCSNGILCQNSKCAECSGNGAYKPAAWARDMDYRPEELGSPETEPACRTCNDTKVVDDGELTHSAGGILYECGPIKCVKDCPDCKSAAQPVFDRDDLALKLRKFIVGNSVAEDRHEAVLWLEALQASVAKTPAVTLSLPDMRGQFVKLAETELAPAMEKGFTTLESGGGKYKIVTEFRNRDDAWTAYKALLTWGIPEPKVKPADSTGS